VGHVTTAEYGSQMLSSAAFTTSPGAPRPRAASPAPPCWLCNGEAVRCIDGGSTVVVQAGAAPVVDGKPEQRMRVGCGSATVGMFASSGAGWSTRWWWSTTTSPACVSEHQAGKVLGMRSRPASKIKGHRSTPGRYFRVSEPGLGWGGTDD
jgi:hypothetical protein